MFFAKLCNFYFSRLSTSRFCPLILTTLLKLLFLLFQSQLYLHHILKQLLKRKWVLIFSLLYSDFPALCWHVLSIHFIASYSISINLFSLTLITLQHSVAYCFCLFSSYYSLSSYCLRHNFWTLSYFNFKLRNSMIGCSKIWSIQNFDIVLCLWEKTDL